MTAESMRVAMYYSNTDVRLEQMPKPPIGPVEILMKVTASGICGSDVMEWYRIHKVPLVLGHEVAGVVDQLGSGVKKFKTGDRIVATHHVPCYKCEYCLKGHESVCETLRKTNFFPGGFSEYIRLPEINVQYGVLKIPQNVSDDEATFVEPLGCVLRGQRLAGTSRGKRVLVIGSGISGLLHIKVAKTAGADALIATDIDPFRLRMAKRSGADFTVQAQDDVPQAVKKHFKGLLADLVILCASNQAAILQGFQSVGRGGKVLIFTAAGKDSGFPLSINDLFWRTELTILSSYAAARVDLKQALTLIAKKKIVVKDMITHQFGLKDAQKGFELVYKPHGSMKVSIRPQ